MPVGRQHPQDKASRRVNDSYKNGGHSSEGIQKEKPKDTPEKKTQMGGFIGNLYQSKLALLFLYRGLSFDYKFLLGTEIDRVAKLDDLVFKYEKKIGNMTKTHYVLIQVKHKMNTRKEYIRLPDLLTTGDSNFGLVKYFNSYQEAKTKISSECNVLEYAIIYTNSNFDLENCYITKIEPDEKNLLQLCKIDNKGEFYKFNSESMLPKLKPQILDYFCEYTKISKKLVDSIVKNKTLMHSDILLKNYHLLLAKYVINVETRKFHNKFVYGQHSGELKYFKEVLEYVLEINKRDLQQVQNGNNPVFTLTKSFGKKEEKSYFRSFVDYGLQKIKGKKSSNPNEIVDENLNNLSEKIVNCLFNGEIMNIEDSILQKYHILLAKHVIDTKNGFFHSEFLNLINTKPEDDDKGLKKFYELVEHKVNEKNQELNLNNINDFLNNEQKKFLLCEGFGLENDDQVQSWPPIKIIITDDIIKEFLDLTVFAVDQPNENGLGIIIEKELKEKYFSNDYIFDTLNTVMINWTKGGNFGSSTSEKVYISSEDAKIFFTQINIKMNKAILKRFLQKYEVKINELKFQDTELIKNMKTFLKGEQKLLNVISEFTRVSSLKIQKILFSIEDEINGRFFILTTLSFLIDKSSSDNYTVLKSFKNKLCSHSLLVIEFDIDINKNSKKYVDDIISQILNYSKSEFGKKLVIITKQSHMYNEYFENRDYKEIQDKLDIDHLTEDSQKLIFDKASVDFQNKSISLKEIFNDKTLIDGSILNNYIDDKNTQIGQLYEGQEDLQHYYISRKLYFERRIENNIVLLFTGFEECDFYENPHNRFDSFKIVEVEEEEELSEESEKSFFENCQENNKDNNICIIRRTDQNFILLKKTENFQLKLSDIKGEINKIFAKSSILLAATPGMGKSSFFSTLCERIKHHNPNLWVYKIDLLNFTKQLNEIKECNHSNNDKFDSFFKAAINLQSDIEVKLFKHFLSNGKAILFFDGLDEITPSYNTEAINIFKAVIKSTKVNRIFVSTRPNNFILEDVKKCFDDLTSCILQPFEEVDQKRFLKKYWEKGLGKENFNYDFFQTFVTELLSEFKNAIKDEKMEFSSVAIHLMMIASTSQELFSSFQSSNMNAIDESQKKQIKGMLKVSSLYEKFVMTKCFDIFYKGKSEFDLLRDPVKESANTLYKDFVNKCKILSLKSIFENDQLESLFPGEMENINEYLSEIEKSGEKYGIILNVVEGKPHFVHKTYAEYFVAVFIIDELNRNQKKRETISSFLLDTIFKKDFEMICDFINNMINDDYCNKTSICIDFEESNKFNEDLLHFVMQNDWENIAKLFLNSGMDLHHLYKDGNTILHLACRMNSFNENSFVEFILEKKKNEPEILIDMLEKKNRFNSTPLFEAIKSNRVANIKSIFNIMDHCKLLEFIHEIKDENHNNLIHLAAMNDSDTILKFLMSDSMKSSYNLENFLQENNKFSLTPLHMCIKHNRLGNVQTLLEKLKELNILETVIQHSNSQNQSNIIHLAAINETDTVLKYLVNELKSNTDLLLAPLLEKNQDNQTPLQSAVSHSRINNTKRLIQALKDLDALHIEFDTKDENGNNILHISIKNSKIDLLQLLLNEMKTNIDSLKIRLQEKNNNHLTPLFQAIKDSSLGKTKVIIDMLRELDLLSILLDKDDLSGNNVIHFVVKNAKDDLLKLLIEELETNVLKTLLGQQNNEYQTPLKLAVSVCPVDKVLVLIEILSKFSLLQVELETKDHDENNILHLAAMNENVDVLQFLLEKLKSDDSRKLKKSLQERNTSSQSPLHSAVKKNRLKNSKVILEMLKEFKIFETIVNTEDSPSKNNLLHLSAIIENDDTLKYLINELKINTPLLKALLEAKNIDFQTPLHLAISFGQIDTAKTLIEILKEVDALKVAFDAKDSENNNIIHLSVKHHNFEILEQLFDELKTNFNFLTKLLKEQNNAYQTPLQLAISNSPMSKIVTLIEIFKKFELLQFVYGAKDKEYNNIIHLSIKQPNAKILEQLINGLKENSELLSSLLEEENKNFQTPLQLAADNFLMNEVLLLVETMSKLSLLKILLYTKDNCLNNIIHIVIRHSNVKLLKQLITLLKADSSILKELLLQNNNNNQTPLKIAIRKYAIPKIMVIIEIFQELSLLKCIIGDKDKENNNIIHLAVKYPNTIRLKQLLSELKTDSDTLKQLLEEKNKFYQTPLQLAYENCTLIKIMVMFDVLAEMGWFNFFISTKKLKNNIIHLAVKHSNIELLKELIVKMRTDSETFKILLSEQNRKHESPLMLAVINSDLYKITLLIKELKELTLLDTVTDVMNCNYNNVIHVAVQNSNVELLQVLISDLNENSDVLISLVQHKNRERQTPLQLAICKYPESTIGLVKVLKQIEFLKYVLLAKDFNDNNIIHLAVKCSNSEQLQHLLVELRTDLATLKMLLQGKNSTFQTPLQLAVSTCPLDKILVLFYFHKELQLLSSACHAKDQYNNNVVHLVITHLEDELFKQQMIDLKTDSDTLKTLLQEKNRGGQTPIELAFSECQINKIIVLVQISIVLDFPLFVSNVKNCEHNNIIHLASLILNDELIKRLLDELLNKNPDVLRSLLLNKNKKGETPLELALNNNNIDSALILRRMQRRLSL